MHTYTLKAFMTHYGSLNAARMLGVKSLSSLYQAMKEGRVINVEVTDGEATGAYECKPLFKFAN